MRFRNIEQTDKQSGYNWLLCRTRNLDFVENINCRARNAQRTTLSRVEVKPGMKKPDDYKIIGLCIYPVLTDHRPAISYRWISTTFLNFTSRSVTIFAILSILLETKDENSQNFNHLISAKRQPHC
jgi:hypothetical protein